MTSEFNGFVFAWLGQEVDAVPAGQLTIIEEGPTVRSSTFGYGSRYLARQNAIPLDPTGLRLEGAMPGARRLYSPENDLPFFGTIRDAMPDLWGRRVIENLLGAPPNSLTETDYLMRAGSNRFGALDVRPAADSLAHDGQLVPIADLRYLLDAADRVQRGEPVPAHLAQLFDAVPAWAARGRRPSSRGTASSTWRSFQRSETASMCPRWSERRSNLRGSAG